MVLIESGDNAVDAAIEGFGVVGQLRCQPLLHFCLRRMCPWAQTVPAMPFGIPQRRIGACKRGHIVAVGTQGGEPHRTVAPAETTKNSFQPRRPQLGESGAYQLHHIEAFQSSFRQCQHTGKQHGTRQQRSAPTAYVDVAAGIHPRASGRGKCYAVPQASQSVCKSSMVVAGIAKQQNLHR